MTTEGPKIKSTERTQDFKLKTISPMTFKDKSFHNLLANNNIQYKKIGDLDKGKYYKYMDLETALICLENGTIRFIEPSRWQDNYESRFYNANFENVLNGKEEAKECPIIFSNCVTRKKNNEAAWKIYTYGKSGIGARCVEFLLSKSKLREQLIKNLKDCTIYEGNVSYVWEDDINSLHQKKIEINGKRINNLWYNLFFNDFGLKEYVNLMLLKRDAFEHEQESRLMIVPNTTTDVKGKKHTINGKRVYGTHLIIDKSDVKIDWGEVIQGVRYDDSCTSIEIKLLNDAVRKAVNFTEKEENWEKDKRYPQCYPVYGIRKRIKIQKK